MIKDQTKRNEYFKQYRKDNEYRFSVAFRLERDTDVINYLKAVPNRTEFLCSLIRQHMKNGNQNQ